jgi:hypothetical protein
VRHASPYFAAVVFDQEDGKPQKNSNITPLCSIKGETGHARDPFAPQWRAIVGTIGHESFSFAH